MDANSINRMKRLIKITHLMYEREARGVAELSWMALDLEGRLAEANSFLDEDSLVGALFPETVIRSVHKLGVQERENAEALARQIGRAVDAKAGNIGAASRLDRLVLQRDKDAAALDLEDLVGSVVRGRMVRLR